MCRPAPGRQIENHQPDEDQLGDDEGHVPTDEPVLFLLTGTKQDHHRRARRRDVRPDAVRVDSQGELDLAHVAFRNLDGTVVLVIQNQREEEADFEVRYRDGAFGYALAPGGDHQGHQAPDRRGRARQAGEASPVGAGDPSGAGDVGDWRVSKAKALSFLKEKGLF